MLTQEKARLSNRSQIHLFLFEVLISTLHRWPLFLFSTGNNIIWCFLTSQFLFVLHIYPHSFIVLVNCDVYYHWIPYMFVPISFSRNVFTHQIRSDTLYVIWVSEVLINDETAWNLQISKWPQSVFSGVHQIKRN